MARPMQKRPPRSKRPARSPRHGSGKDAAGAGAASVPGEPMRIAKYLARSGVASRREVERMIADGRVRVGGNVLETPAFTVTGAERIEVDGAPVAGPERTRLWLFHKPTGLVTTNKDPEGRRTVFDALPEGTPRVVSIGRLDINTEGLLLLTNDGGLSRLLELPSTGWLRRYRVRAHGRVSQAQLDTLKEGIAVEGVLYGAMEAEVEREQGGNTWLTVAIREGKNREVKKVLGALGLEVNRLIRISYGPFQLGELKPGELREVKGRTLRDQLGVRLIEQAGANFDAPILNETPNRPTPKPRATAKRARPSDRPETGRTKETKPKREPKKTDKRGGPPSKGNGGRGADRRR